MLAATAADTEVKKLLALCIADGMPPVRRNGEGEGSLYFKERDKRLLFPLLRNLHAESSEKERYVRIEIAEISRNLVRGETVPSLSAVVRPSVREQKSWTPLA